MCWVIILWAMAVGVHVPHPGEDGSDMWVTKTLRLRHKESVRGEEGWGCGGRAVWCRMSTRLTVMLLVYYGKRREGEATWQASRGRSSGLRST